MAQEKNQEFNNLNSAKTNSYTKGLIKDFNDTFVPEGVWINAINAVSNSHKGDIGTVGNEPSNIYCAEAPFSIIGIVRQFTDSWVVFSTNNVQSEIGIFTESTCSYQKVVTDRCLNFKKEYLITGFIQYNFDCTWSVFFADGLNPDRSLNLDNPPHKLDYWDTTNPDCPIPVYTECLDCEQIRLNYLVNPPCPVVKKSTGAGSLLNGSYQVAVAYTINEQRVTNYFTPSNIVPLWSHEGVGGGLEITLTNLDQRFKEYELVIISTINSQTVAKSLGFYNTTQTVIHVDGYNESLVTVPLSDIPLITPIYEKSDKMFSLGGYLLRSGVHSKYNFNYQPIANQINTYWQEVEYPANYYYKGGANATYMRDEQYSFFIRWIYNDGDKSASYHIPGRAPEPGDFDIINNPDVLFNQKSRWQVYNTCSVTNSTVNTQLPDGGIITREGLMGYWESSEKYPSDKPEVWADLCGKNIRHHKFPDNATTHIHNQGGDKIYLLGVRFDNIQHPLDAEGSPIENIIGFEILRGSREGNRTIIAKGLINNMREYTNTLGKGMLYQNYPYNDLRPDYFLKTAPGANGDDPDDTTGALTKYKKDYYSFHSPDTNFNRPFLSYNEVKLYTKEYGRTEGSFQYPYGAPRQKLITNTSYLLALTIGLGIGIGNAIPHEVGTGTDIKSNPEAAAANVALSTLSTTAIPPTNPQTIAALAAYTAAGTTPTAFTNSVGGGALIGPGSSGNLSFLTTGINGPTTTIDANGALGGFAQIGTLFPGWNTGAGRFAQKLISWGLFVSTINYWAGQGMSEALKVIFNVIPFHQYTLQFNSHGFYSNYKPVSYKSQEGYTRREHDYSRYIKDQIQSFDANYSINNLFRGNYVSVKIKGSLPDVSENESSSLVDNTRQRVRDTSLPFNNPVNQGVSANTSAYYAGLKIDYENQYGQIDGIVEIPIQPCYTYTNYKLKDTTYSSPTLFGGDIYINRYTEKNPFAYFTDWQFNVPDGTAFDYRGYYNVMYPRYWANFDELDGSNVKTPLNFNAVKNLITGGGLSAIVSASTYHYLDRKNSATNSFLVTSAWFYLFNNGVRDFFVESEVNLAFRDYGDLPSQRHYDNTDYTDYNEMFRSDIIKAGNYYKYDYSLSSSKIWSNYQSFGTMLPRSYDPLIAKTCYTYREYRMLYSLPQNTETSRDAWRIYLPNNYKEFDNKVSAVKPINRTGSIILFEDAKPTSVTGVDQLETGAGTKITIGDGGLFAQPFQTLVNSDDEYEYASCQDLHSVVNTPYGVFWMSRGNGKVLQYVGNQIIDIAMNGMRYWFAQNLPNVLTQQIPDFPYTENTVVGIGCDAIYDAQYEIVYFTKKDYKAASNVKYDATLNKFYVEKQSGTVYFEIGDPEYFEDCSWTISYDPKNKMWLSFHDWHPTFMIGTNDHFYTIDDRKFWKHNSTCASYCNFYGKDYAFEVEFPVNTGSEVTTFKNVEYTLEVLNYSNDCQDPYHVLNQNFDYAMVYNTEQNSGLLKLNLSPMNPVELLQYPAVRPSYIDIAFSKIENKYRFNQFWDATKDRGQFSGTQYRMFNTEQNGYKKVLNTTYIDYAKPPMQRKRFRHYGNRIILGKYISHNLKFNLKVVNSKETHSPR